MRKVFVALFVVAMALGTASAVVCPISTCEALDQLLPTKWLNSSSMNTRITGPQMTFYPRQPDGNAFLEAFASIGLLHLAEMKLTTDGYCETDTLTLEGALTTGRVARYLNMSESCCEVMLDEGMLTPTVHRDVVMVNITRPDYPDFWMEVVLSMANDTIIFPKPGNADIGSGYNITYEAGKVKATFNIYNWPWITDEQPSAGYGDTYIALFFYTQSQLDQYGRIRAYDEDKWMHYTAQTDKALIKVDFLKVYTCDGADHFSHANDFTFPLDFNNTMAFNFPAVIGICQGWGPVLPRWKTLNYDPNLNALFTPPIAPETPNSPSASKRILNPAAYVVPIVVVVAVLAAVGIYLFVMKPRKATWKKATPSDAAAAKA